MNLILIITFIANIIAICDMHECNYYCHTCKQNPYDYSKKWYGVCEPINSPPEERECRCGFHIKHN